MNITIPDRRNAILDAFNERGLSSRKRMAHTKNTPLHMALVGLFSVAATAAFIVIGIIILRGGA